jgi:hypothetical protein
MNLLEWAIAWNVPMLAVEDLRRRMGMEGAAAASAVDVKARRTSEEYVQSVVRLEAPRKGVHLWRNNVGALTDERGVPVRYGLANDSAKINKVIKSADLIGCRPVVIAPAMVGTTIGQFVSRECKRVGWNYGGDSHEVAQLNWANLILSLGGDAGFTTGEGSL